MDLLNQNHDNGSIQPKGKKIILGLLIVSVIAAITIIIVMFYLSLNTETKMELYINGKKTEIPQGLIVSDTQGVRYISLKGIASLLELEYYNSEYNNYGTDTTKCHIKNGKLISGFEQNSNKIYKYEEDTNLDYQYYKLKQNIISYNNDLYISLEEDLGKSLNISIIIEENVIKINSLQYLISLYETEVSKKGYTLTSDLNNQKALSYGWVIVSKNGVWGVLNENLEKIIDLKYSSIYFDEYNLNYIVSNVKKQYGIISPSGEIDASIDTLKYDDMEILNYENGLYKVKYNNKYGILKSNGTMLTTIEYDDIGYEANSQSKILYTLIIPSLEEKTVPSIIVKKDKYYGLIKLETGEMYLPCDHVEKLYSTIELGEMYYKIEAEGITMDLIEYLELRKMV